MGFKFQGVSLKHVNPKKQLQEIKPQLFEILYKYIFDSHITILCKLTLVPYRQDVTASYSVLAPANTLKTLHHDN